MTNAQALIGTMLGTCVLEELVAHGETGAVFFARDTFSQEQVVVKIVFPPSTAAHQGPSARADFLERFQRDMAAVAALSHQHILPLHTFGEQRGLAYLVMPHIPDGSLADLLRREGQLAMPRLLSCLEQVAAALDYAHGRGVMHYHLKPTNVLLAREGNALVADFGQATLVATRATSQMSLLRAGSPVASLEYMAPEQLMGDVLDARTDLYALGILLYQMLTGRTPFHGATPLQLATMLVQSAPPPPSSLRSDLTAAAEQVLLHALAKRAQDRYARAQDFVAAFRASLASGASEPGAPAAFKKRARGLFDPIWQHTTDGQAPPAAAGGAGLFPPLFAERVQGATALPADEQAAPPPSFPRVRTGLLPPVHGMGVTRTLSPAAREPGTTGTDALAAAQSPVLDPQSPFPASYPPGAQPTGTLGSSTLEQAGNATVRLTGAMKVIQVPVAGQPGRFVTGLLPVQPTAQAAQAEAAGATAATGKTQILNSRQKIVTLILLVAVVVSASGLFWFLHAHTGTPAKYGVQTEHVAPDFQAITAARASATAAANTILADPLTTNIHNWPLAASGSKLYRFEQDGYHITDNDPHQSAPAILPDLVLKGPMVYSLTMREVKGDDGSINNSFGMILRLSTHTAGNKNIVSFYCFEVVNDKGGKYELVKYDSSSKGQSPWIPIWQHAYGHEFHQGHGKAHSNTLKVVAKGKSFSFFVNGKQVGKATNGSLTQGEIGMLVNLKGTEVVFSDLLVTSI